MHCPAICLVLACTLCSSIGMQRKNKPDKYEAFEPDPPVPAAQWLGDEKYSQMDQYLAEQTNINYRVPFKQEVQPREPGRPHAMQGGIPDPNFHPALSDALETARVAIDCASKKGGNYVWNPVTNACVLVRKCKNQNFVWDEVLLRCVVREPPKPENRSPYQKTQLTPDTDPENCEPLIIPLPTIMPKTTPQPDVTPLPSVKTPPVQPWEKTNKSKEETDWNAPKDLHYMRGKCLNEKQTTDTYNKELNRYIGPTPVHKEQVMSDQPDRYRMPEGTPLHFAEPTPPLMDDRPLIMPDPHADTDSPSQGTVMDTLGQQHREMGGTNHA